MISIKAFLATAVLLSSSLVACSSDDGKAVRTIGDAASGPTEFVPSASGSASGSGSASASAPASGSESESASASGSASASAPASEGSESEGASGSASASAPSSEGSEAASGSASGSASAPGEAVCSPVGEELEGDADQTIEVIADEYAFDPSDIEVEAGIVTFEVVNEGEENHELAFLPGGGDVPFTDGAPDEDALAEEGAFELEAFGPGQTCNATYELEAGEYSLFCIVESEDGSTHYQQGMGGTLIVS